MKSCSITKHQGNTNQNHNKLHLISQQVGWLLSKRKEVNDEDVEKREHLYFVGENVNWYSTIKNSINIPQETENRTNI